MSPSFMNKPLALIAVAILGAGFQSAAVAAASTSVTANSRVNATKGFQPGDAVNQGSTTTGDLVVQSGPITAAAQTAGTADYGVLRGSAGTGVVSTATGAQPSVLGSANASVILTANDTFTITSSELAFGTEVSFSVIMAFSREYEALGQNNNGSASLTLTLDGQDNRMISFFPEFDGFPNSPDIMAFEFDTTIGAVFDVTFQMVLASESIYNQTGIGEAGSIAAVDASDTGLFSFTPFAGNYGYTTESGTDYTAPVPEPETYAMLLAGLGLVGFAARRRLSQRV